jgi:hypothetical protein
MNIYGLAPISGGCHWYRIREPLRGLAGLGHATEWGELFDESIVGRNDTILTHALHGDEATMAWEYLAGAKQHRLIIDVDDNYWQFDEGTDHHAYWTAERLEQLELNIRRSHLVTTPSPVLADLIRFKLGLNDNVAVLGNYVPGWMLSISKVQPAAFTVGYQGAPQKLHQSDLDSMQEELFWFLERCKDARLVFFGQPTAMEGSGPFADRIDTIPWNPSIPEYYRTLHMMTVGIGPLRRSPSTEAKSGIRAVEFAALGIPGLYTNATPYREVVHHRDTGYLVSDTKDWRKILTKLYKHPEIVERVSRRARALASEWTTEANAWRFEQAYQGSGPGAVVSSAP